MLNKLVKMGEKNNPPFYLIVLMYRQQSHYDLDVMSWMSSFELQNQSVFLINCLNALLLCCDTFPGDERPKVMSNVFKSVSICDNLCMYSKLMLPATKVGGV